MSFGTQSYSMFRHFTFLVKNKSLKPSIPKILSSILILSVAIFEQTETLFRELEKWNFKNLVIQKMLLMMFKYSLGIVPKPITLLFTRNDEIHHHNP